MMRELQNEVVFTGTYPARTDDNGRLWIPKSMSCNPGDLEVQVDLVVGRIIYLRKEDYGLYATLVTPGLYQYFFEKEDNDGERADFFGNGKFATIRNSGGDIDNGGRRITLGKALANLDMRVVGQAHFFKLIPDEEGLKDKGLVWRDFELFSRSYKEHEE